MAQAVLYEHLNQSASECLTSGLMPLTYQVHIVVTSYKDINENNLAMRQMATSENVVRAPGADAGAAIV